MGATIIVNGRTVVHKDSGGKAPSVPDFCKTPTPPGPPVPIPYVNIAQSTDTADGSSKVKMDGNPIMLKTSKFSTSKGDEAGTAKGVVSSTTSGIAKFVNYSFDVKVEDKNVPRLGDPMTNNGNAPNANTIKELQIKFDVTEEEIQFLCHIFCEALKEGEQARQDAGRWRSFTRRLRRYIEKLRQDYPYFSNVTLEKYFPVMFGGVQRRAFPDILLYDTTGRLKQIGDFKFPGDTFSDDQRGRYEQVAQDHKATKEIMIIDCAVCECEQCP
ncbi:MAG: DUF4150 domain-containing protein [Desulfobacterales bacterium]|nr:DUF4150 domain-containing protein [Desulfobacterales bacterium]